MIAADFLQTFGWIIVAAAVFALLARFVRLPSIVAYLLAGIFLGSIAGVADDKAPLDLVSETGIVLLLFLVGLELSLNKIRDVGAVALCAGLGQVLFTFVGGLGLCRLLGFSWMEALFLSCALTFSSTVVAVKLLTDKGELDTTYGRIAVGNSLVQTLVVIVVLILLNGLTGDAVLSIGGVFRQTAVSFAKAVLLFFTVIACAKFLLPKPMSAIASSPASIFVLSLCWCFAVVVFAGYLDLSIEIGALLAGLSLAQFPFSRDLQYRIKPLMNLFVAVFFVALGIRTDFGDPLQYFFPAVVLGLFVLIGNPLIFMTLIPRFGYDGRTSLSAGLTGAQISEFSFVFVAMGAAAGLIGDRVVAIIAMVGVLTIAVSAYFILYSSSICRLLARTKFFEIFGVRAEMSSASGGSAVPRDHIIVVGMNSLGKRIATTLLEKGFRVIAMDTDSKKLEGLGCEKLVGSSEYLDILLDAGLPDARLLVSALRIEEANELLAYRCRQYGVPCAVHAVDISMVENLMDLDVSYLMLSKVDGIKLQNRYLQEEGVLPR